MNKISKKIVALITMAMFVLTLVPAAAFAADGDANWLTSYFTAVVDDEEVSEVTVEAFNNKTNVNEQNKDEATVQTKIQELTEKNQVLNGGAHLGTVQIWAQDSKGNITDALRLDGVAEEADHIYDVQSDAAIPAMYFIRPDTYTIYAAQTAPTASAKAVNVLGSVKVNAEDNNTVDYVTYAGKTYTNNQTAKATFKGQLNGIETNKITATAFNSDKIALYNKEFTLSASGGNAVSFEKDTVKTNRAGEFTIEYSVAQAGVYTITATNDDITVKFQVTATSTGTPVAIETVKNDAQVLEAKAYSAGSFLTDAVEFQLTDAKGNVLSGEDVLDGQNVNQGSTNDKYMKVVKKPAKSKLTNKSFKLDWDEDNQAYTIRLVSGVNSNQFIAGEYSLRLALNNGATATCDFTVAEPGEPNDVVLEITQGTTDDEVNDTVIAGNAVTVKAYYIDENGVKVPDTNAKFGYAGKAVATPDTTGTAGQMTFTVDAGTDDKYIGSVITVKVFDENFGKYVEKELTVVQSDDNAYTLDFASTEGNIAKNNTVKFTVVDEDGNKVSNVSGEIYTYVADQSNKDANVTTTKVGKVTKGEGTITLYSDKQTSADIVVGVKDDKEVAGKPDNYNIYAGTLKYTFGEKEQAADTSVVMTIGSSDMVVNNVVVTGDAAPYVKNSRTYVPIRALTQAFGAKVDWNGTDRTVTVTLGDKVVVMTVDKTDYTVDGTAKTMDVAPEIVGDRTYVPVRFVGEALGFDVTALYDSATGTTASVVFQK